MTKHERLHAHLETLIQGGIGPDQRLPPERELAEAFGVSRMTVRHALDRLERERRVYRVQGAGTFVARPPIAKTIELTSFTEDMRRRGLVPGSVLRVFETVAAGPEIGYALSLSPADEVVHVERVRTADGIPMCLEHAYLPAALVPGLTTLEGSLYSELHRRYRIRITHAEQSIRATVLDQEAAARLDAPPFSPALLVERTAFDERDRPVERAMSTYRGDRYSFEIAVTTAAAGSPARAGRRSGGE
ncbi:GntR family transcriptional regulator [Dactylosporangium sp. NPDC000244]|uniref:GntR family transcriptional regulator n=1 Tax=Dactylosporangium sp. NPDC000244 TaxID=3154365 RepID=UPI00332E882F